MLFSLPGRCRSKLELIYDNLKINRAKLIDWKSFHSGFKKELNFPDYYGENLNAWIDCMDDVSEKPVTLLIENVLVLKEKAPELLMAIFECSAFINYQKIQSEQNPNLIVASIS